MQKGLLYIKCKQQSLIKHWRVAKEYRNFNQVLGEEINETYEIKLVKNQNEFDSKWLVLFVFRGIEN